MSKYDFRGAKLGVENICITKYKFNKDGTMGVIVYVDVEYDGESYSTHRSIRLKKQTSEKRDKG